MVRLLLVLLAWSSVSDGATRACNIPVFRYALERWPAAPYDVVAFHRGPLGDEGRAALNELRQAGANLELDRIDLAEPMAPKRKSLAERLKIDEPCLVALFPGSERLAWTGPLTSDSARRLAASPARQEIAKRLLQGDSAVWILLESGDQAKDDETAALLGGELKKLEQTLKLPAHAADDPPLLSEVPVRVAFSLFRLSRTSPAESALVAMLLSSDDGLEGPVAFPVFGRGRALWAMAGKGMTAENINEAAMFLAGACSCEAKELNPGVDLLFAADWEAGLAAAEDRPAVPAPNLKPRIPERQTGPSSPPRDSGAALWGALIVAGLFVAVAGRKVLAASKPPK